MKYVYVTGYECNTLYAYSTFSKAFEALKQEIINDGNEDVLCDLEPMEEMIGTNHLTIGDFYWIREIEFKE